MPIPYESIKVQAALKLAQIKGATQAELETYYTGAWASALDGAEIPITGFRDQILMIEKTFAEAIGDNPSHPARSLLYGASVALSTGDAIPNTSSASYEWVGVFDSVVDSDDGLPLTAQPIQTINDLNNVYYDDTAFYYYAMFGNNIYHTRDEVILQGCVWDLTTQETEYDADGDSPLPQYLANGLVSGVIASAPQVGWVDNSPAFQIHAQIYQEALASIASPGTALPLTATVGAAG